MYGTSLYVRYYTNYVKQTYLQIQVQQQKLLEDYYPTTTTIRGINIKLKEQEITRNWFQKICTLGENSVAIQTNF